MPDRSSDVQVERFLDRFFSAPNIVQRADIRSGGSAEKLLPWVALAKGHNPATCLPRRTTAQDDWVDWYAVARDESTLRRLGEELSAFVGPSWSTFRGQRAHLDMSDPIDRAVQEFTSGLAFKFGGRRAPVFESLERMRGVWSRRPRITADTPRAVGRVLRDFYMALRAGNRASAQEQLDYLRRRGQLTELNRLFLRVQMLDELELDAELLELPELSDLLQARRPLAVTQALLVAAYRSVILAQENSPPDALAAFRAHIARRFDALFTSEQGMTRGDALRLFMLRAVADNDPSLRDRLLKVPTDVATAGIMHAFSALMIPSAALYAADPLMAATEAADTGDFGRAFELAVSAAPSLKRAMVLCQCAYETPSLAVETAAIEAIFALPSDHYEIVMRHRLIREFVELHTAKVDDVAEQGRKVIIDGWVTWVEQLFAGILERMAAIDLARRGAAEWNPAELAERPVEIARLGTLIADPPPGMLVTLSDAFPHLLAFFQRDELWPRKAFASIYAQMAELLAQTTAGAMDDLVLFVDLLAARLETGMEPPAYRELLEAVRLLVEEHSSPATLDWMLDTLETLTFQDCPDKSARLEILKLVGTQFYNFRDRMTATQRWLLERLHHELGEADLFRNLLPPELPRRQDQQGVGADPVQTDPLSRFSGKSIAIYTLNDRAAQVVEALLRERIDDVTVHLNNDLAGTPRLKQLAHNADVFVMTLGSAKHAATEFIAANRPTGKPLLRTGKRSKGSSGIIAQLMQYSSDSSFCGQQQ